jgi:KH/beta-lactamase-domain protein
LEEEVKPETKNTIEIVKSLIPKEAGLTKAEFEGPDVAIYVKNVAAIYGNENVIRNVSTTVKKKLIVRSDTASLMEPEKATKKIIEIVPQEAGISEEGIRYVPEFNEVQIEAHKPGLVIGKGGSTLIKIVLETGWVPKVLRIPTMNSDVIKGVRQMLVKEADFRRKFLLNIGKKINTPIMKSEWIKATALGGFREVGRSSLLIETNHSKIIIDCGVSPEPAIKGIDAITGDENKAFPYLDSANITINDLDAVILTHAHMDHIGFVPYLFKFGYEGPVYCTPPTRDLGALLLYDYNKLVQRSGGTPLYEEKDIRKMLSHMITRDYGEVTNVTDEIKLTYHNAGHILGSGLVHLHIGEGLYNIVHSGDLKYGFTRLLDQADTRYPRIDSLFIESTYGGARDFSAPRQDSEMEFMELIKNVIENKGKVLLPVLAIGRAQELMLILETYVANNPRYKLDVPIYLDGMILESSAIHTAYPEYLKASLQHRILSNNSPFENEIFEVAKGERQDIIDKGPSIILASGGMLNGGTALEYFKALAEDEKNAIIFSSYTSVSSLGRKVVNGFKEIPLPGDDGKLVPVNIRMRVHRIEGFSGHSDRRQLMNFVQSLRPGQPKKIYTMHGEEQKCEDLARTLGMKFRVEARAPMNLDSIRFK